MCRLPYQEQKARIFLFKKISEKKMEKKYCLNQHIMITWRISSNEPRDPTIVLTAPLIVSLQQWSSDDECFDLRYSICFARLITNEPNRFNSFPRPEYSTPSAGKYSTPSAGKYSRPSPGMSYRGAQFCSVPRRQILDLSSLDSLHTPGV